MKRLMSGNEAIAEAAIRAGCTHYFGYPITPQNEIPEYMAERMPDVGRRLHPGRERDRRHQHGLRRRRRRRARHDLVASPGISLKQEGISYLAGAELPAVIVNVMRGGPGLGNIARAQATTSRPHGRRPRRLPHDRAGAGLRPGAARTSSRWPSTWPTSTAPR